MAEQADWRRHPQIAWQGAIYLEQLAPRLERKRQTSAGGPPRPGKYPFGLPAMRFHLFAKTQIGEKVLGIINFHLSAKMRIGEIFLEGFNLPLPGCLAPVAYRTAEAAAEEFLQVAVALEAAHAGDVADGGLRLLQQRADAPEPRVHFIHSSAKIMLVKTHKMKLWYDGCVCDSGTEPWKTPKRN